jgi:serine/threonine-protein phosphatase PGAM5
MLPRLLLLLAGLLMASPLFAVETPATRTIILVRHGYYLPDANADPKLGPHLAPIGVAQAHLVGARLAGLPTRFDTMYVSPVQRARDTAAVIAGDFPDRHFEIVDDLAECTPPTRRTEATVGEKPADLVACKKQFDRLFAHYFTPAHGHAQTELMVCHGNVIRNMVVRALGVDSQAWLEMSVGNASITKILIEPDGRFKVIAVGDVGHIPPSLRTGATGDMERSLAIPELP